MARQPILIAACGKRGVGKSYTTMKYLRQYVRGNPAAGIPGRKVLIFDVNNEYSDKSKFPDVRAISLKDVPLFSAQPFSCIRRISPFFDNNLRMTLDDMVTVLQWLLTNFWDGLLVVEDINKYVSDHMPADIVGSICTNRHSGVDIMLHYQSIGRLSPKVWQNINVIRLHKNSDSVDQHQSKFEDKYEYLKIAENIVWTRFRAKDERFYLFVDFDKEKIFAEVDEEEKRNSINDYISHNYRKIITPKLSILDRTGKRKYTTQTAYEEEETRMYTDYF